LLAHPDWRLVHFDALAALYLLRGEPGLEQRFPALDLGARHFRSPLAASVPDTPGAARKETVALVNIGTALARFPELTWQLRIPILLSSLDRADWAMQQESSPAGVWTILGNAYWSLSPNLRTPPPIPSSEWNLRSSIRWAQQSYCLRQAQALNPSDVRVLTELRRSLGARQMVDAMQTVGEELLATGKLDSEQSDEILAINKRVGPPVELPMLSPDQARVVVGRLLQAGRVEDATRLAEIVGAGGWTSWDAQLIDQIAGAHMQLGDPIRAREMWEKATASHKEAGRLIRLAATYWVERDLKQAVVLGQQAREKDPQSADAHWLLAWLYTEQGDAERALRVIEDAQMPEIREEFDLLRTMLLRYHTRGESI
jgi:TPR repeat protein